MFSTAIGICLLLVMFCGTIALLEILLINILDFFEYIVEYWHRK
jgi:hypothetical protein